MRISNSNLKCNTYYKPGGTTMYTLNNISSAVLKKRNDKSGIGRWTFITILGKNNERTYIFTVYRPCKGAIPSAGDSALIKQHWLVMQSTNRNDHSHKTAIYNFIIEVKKSEI